MAPRPLPAATLAATVLLAAVCPVASADSETDPSAETTGSSAAPAPAGGDTTGGAQALAQDTVAAGAGAAAEVVSTPAAPQQGGSGGAPTAATSSPATPSSTSPPPAQQEAATGTTARPLAESQTPPQPPSGSDLSRPPTTGDALRPAPAAPPAAPPKAEAAKVVVTAPTVPAPPPSTPDASAAAAPPPKHADRLQRLIHDADRGLREIQGQIGELGRRLEVDGFAPTSGLVRLRHGLDRIAPVLLALDARLDAAPALTPRLKALVHRVHSRLERAQASSRDLMSALLHSGVDRAALRLLLRELERFVAFDSAPAVTLGERPAPAPFGAAEPAPYTAYTQIEAAPAAAPHDDAAAHSPGRRGDGRHAEGQRDPGSPQDVPPSSPAPGSASAGPGGAFSAAGLALLAALLAALALTGPRTRLQPTASRLYRAAFLTPLERPG